MCFSPQILTTVLKNVMITKTAITLGGKELFGVCLVRILCPQNLLYPFLQLRDIHSGRVTTPVCRLCNENMEVQLCKHSKRLLMIVLKCQLATDKFVF